MNRESRAPLWVELVSRAVLAASLVALPACSSNSASGVAGEDAATPPPDAEPEGTLDAGPITDAATQPVDVPDVLFNYDDCTNIAFDQDDESAPDASRHIVFSFHANTQQYAPRCMIIKAGQSITWEGDFSDHPLVGAGGDIPNPIDVASIATGTEGTITFPTAGWYGFECAIHEAPAEYGAILVEP